MRVVCPLPLGDDMSTMGDASAESLASVRQTFWGHRAELVPAMIQHRKSMVVAMWKLLDINLLHAAGQPPEFFHYSITKTLP